MKKNIIIVVLALMSIGLGAYSLNLKKTLDDFQSVTIKRFDCTQPSDDRLVSLWCQLDKQYATSPLAGKDSLISRDDYINGWVSILQQQLLSPDSNTPPMQSDTSWQAGQQQAQTAFQQYLDNRIAKTFIIPFQKSSSTQLSLLIKESFEKARLDSHSPIAEVQFTFGYLTGRLATLEKPQRLDILASPATTADRLKAMSAKEAQSSHTEAMTDSFAKGLETGIFDSMIQLQQTVRRGLQSLPSTMSSPKPLANR